MNFENYLIPAQEGFFTTNIHEENIDLLKKRQSLLVCTTDHESIYGGIDISKYVKNYGFKGAARVRLFANVDCSVNNEELFNFIGPVIESNKDHPEKIIEFIVKACDKWSKKTNMLVVCTLDTNYFYKEPFARSHPIIIVNTSRVRTTINGILRNRESLKDINRRYTMQTALSHKLPRHYYLKDASEICLYHISPKQLKVLTPQITRKPMDKENFGIPRISAAPTVDQCFKAVGTKVDQCPIRYYVYRLLTKPDTRVAKVDKKLVPDADETNEHWVLDPVEVECMGYVNVLYNHSTDKFDYDVHIK